MLLLCGWLKCIDCVLILVDCMFYFFGGCVVEVHNYEIEFGVDQCVLIECVLV